MYVSIYVLVPYETGLALTLILSFPCGPNTLTLTSNQFHPATPPPSLTQYHISAYSEILIQIILMNKAGTSKIGRVMHTLF
jgi:hypothetical protein